METKLIYLKLEPYLKDWFIHEHGGKVPVDLKKNSPEMNIIHGFISIKPADYVDDHNETDVPIEVPVFKGLNPQSWCYLPPRSKQLLYNCIKNCFDTELFNEMMEMRKMHVSVTDLLYVFMEKHGINETETNWLALMKIYQRKTDSYRKWRRRKK